MLLVPAQPLGQPVVEPLWRFARGHEVLHLHLLELTGAKDEVLRSYLVAEGLPHLGDTERRSLASRVEDVCEVGEHALGRLWTQVRNVALVLYWACMGLEHQVERPCGREVLRAAFRADPVDLVLPPPFVAAPAIDKRIGEVLEVTRGLPDGSRREDRCVKAHDVLAQLDHRAPPGVFYVAKKIDTERAIVVSGSESAVDLRRGEDDPAALAEIDDLGEEVRVLGALLFLFRRLHRHQRRIPAAYEVTSRSVPSYGWGTVGMWSLRWRVTTFANSRPRKVRTALPERRSTSPS